MIAAVLDKARALRRRIDERGLDTRIEIDGGVTLDNLDLVAATGVDMIVAGSAVFGADDVRRDGAADGPAPGRTGGTLSGPAEAGPGRAGADRRPRALPETDRMGVAYHAHYFVWFEMARTELMRRSGCAYKDLEDRDGILFPVIRAGARYRASARYDDWLDVDRAPRSVGGSKLRFEYEVTSRDERGAAGHGVHRTCLRGPERTPQAAARGA